MESQVRSLSVVIPAFNEEARLPATLQRVHSFLDGRAYDAEILVVDDGSRDRTADVVLEMRSRFPRLRLLRQPRNFGAGQAVRAGVLDARKEAVLYTDADLSTPIEELDALWSQFDRGCDVVMGSRYAQQSLIRSRQPVHRRLLGRVFRLLVALLAVRGFQDTQCGFKLYRTASVQALFVGLRSRGFTFNIEVLQRARARGLRIAEVPVAWSNDPDSRLSIAREGLRSLLEILRMRGG